MTAVITSVPRGAVNLSTRWTSAGDITVPLVLVSKVANDQPPLAPFLCVSHDDMISNGFVAIDGYRDIYHRRDEVGGGVYSPFINGLSPIGMGGVAFFGSGIDMRFGGMCATTVIAKAVSMRPAPTVDKGCVLVVTPTSHFMYGAPGASMVQDISPVVVTKTTEEVPDGVDGEGKPKVRIVVTEHRQEAPNPWPCNVDASFTIRNGGVGHASPVATMHGACCVRMYVPPEAIDMRHTPDVTGLVPTAMEPVSKAVYSSRYAFAPLVVDPLVARSSKVIFRLADFNLKGMLQAYDFAKELGIKAVLYKRADMTKVRGAIAALDGSYDLMIELSLNEPYDRLNTLRSMLRTQPYKFTANEGSGQVAYGLGLLPPLEHRVPDLFSDAPLVNGYTLCGPPECTLAGYSFGMVDQQDNERAVNIEFADYSISVDRVRALFGLRPLGQVDDGTLTKRVSCFTLPLPTVEREAAALRAPLYIIDPTGDGTSLLDAGNSTGIDRIGAAYEELSEENKAAERGKLASENSSSQKQLADAITGSEAQYYPGGHPCALLNQPAYVAFSRILSLVDQAVSDAGHV